jgi:hypothetical protein
VTSDREDEHRNRSAAAPNLSIDDHVRPAFAVGVIVTLVALKLVLHFTTNVFGPYEFHRDEFMYMAMGEHLRLWSMDFPPAIAILSELARGVLGDSLFAVRFFPAVFSAAILVFAALIARELGGGRYAQGSAGLCVLAVTLFQRSGNLFQPVVFDQFWWTLGLYALIRRWRTEDPSWWLLFGAACGFGLLSKFSILIFGLAALLALLVTRYRRDLATPWPWIAALMAFTIGSPSIVGQIRLSWPILDQLGDLQRAQLARVTAGAFLRFQMLWGPAVAVAAVGLVSLLTARTLTRYRVVGWTCLWAFIILIALRGKPYYIGPVYPMLFAAGAVVLDGVRLPRWGPVLRWLTVGAVAAYGILLLPLGLPILSPPTMERYLTALGSDRAVTTNVGAVERLPQDYADMLGWEELVASVADVYRGLDNNERDQAVLLTSNYGEAGAIDFYGPRYGLPKAVAFVGTYWFFGPGDRPGDVTIAVGYPGDDLGRFETCEAAGSHTHPYAVAEQRDLTHFVCRRPRVTLQEVWPSLEGQQ